MFDFFEAYFEEGYIFLFKWGIAMCETLKDQLLAIPTTNVSKLFALLRLDPYVMSWHGNYDNGGEMVRLRADLA